MKRHDAMTVGDIIARAIAATGNADEFERQHACYIWGEVVGPGINRMTTRRWISGDEMHVVIAPAVIKSELSFRKESLTDEINRRIGKKIISRIVIH